jgi:S-adenosylmethionine decarboxylase
MHALGQHLLVELFGCNPDALKNLETVKLSMVEAAKRAQATIVSVVSHEFPSGVKVFIVIAESHLSIKTWPQYRYAALDVFTCGDVLDPQVAASFLQEAFDAQCIVTSFLRGIFPDAVGPLPHRPILTAVSTL